MHKVCGVAIKAIVARGLSRFCILGFLLGCLLLLMLTAPVIAASAIASPERSAQYPVQYSDQYPGEYSGKRSAAPPDIQRIRDRGKLIVAALKQDNAPFFMVNSQGKLGGLDMKLAQAIADQLGVGLEVNRSASTFDQVVDTVYRLDADLAFSKLSRTLKRSQRVRFSRPYLTMRQGLLVNRLQMAQQANGQTVTQMIRDLHGKIGVIKGSSYVGFTQQKFPKATIVEYASWSAVMDAVIRGDILAAYRDELEVKKIVLGKPDAALQLQTIALTDTQDAIAIALPWDSGQLLAFTEQYLDMMQVHYTADKVLDEYSDYLKVLKVSQP